MVSRALESRVENVRFGGGRALRRTVVTGVHGPVGAEGLRDRGRGVTIVLLWNTFSRPAH